MQCAYVYGTFCLDYSTRCYVSMSLLHNKVKNQVIYVIRLPIKVYLGPYWFENKVHICIHFKFLTKISYVFFFILSEINLHVSNQALKSYCMDDFKGNGTLLPKLFWPTMRKNCSNDWEFFFLNFEITRTIFSNSRSE